MLASVDAESNEVFHDASAQFAYRTFLEDVSAETTNIIAVAREFKYGNTLERPKHRLWKKDRAKLKNDWRDVVD